jgi:hypothetical protein
VQVTETRKNSRILISKIMIMKKAKMMGTTETSLPTRNLMAAKETVAATMIAWATIKTAEVLAMKTETRKIIEASEITTSEIEVVKRARVLSSTTI